MSKCGRDDPLNDLALNVDYLNKKVRTYSEWVIDGEYDWPAKCCHCQVALEEGTGPQTTRLGCLHVIHTNCLVSFVQSFPPHTAPAGYTCPACSTPTNMYPIRHMNLYIFNKIFFQHAVKRRSFLSCPSSFGYGLPRVLKIQDHVFILS
ncbi:hypothetical protein NL676_015789 [Syzygium grande]|nr:hypothetical protein NL676_015789 [Syzygium grande]